MVAQTSRGTLVGLGEKGNETLLDNWTRSTTAVPFMSEFVILFHVNSNSYLEVIPIPTEQPPAKRSSESNKYTVSIADKVCVKKVRVHSMEGRQSVNL